MKQFVNDAFAQDPRILQRRAEEKAQRWDFPAACAEFGQYFGQYIGQFIGQYIGRFIGQCMGQVGTQ